MREVIARYNGPDFKLHLAGGPVIEGTLMTAMQRDIYERVSVLDREHALPPRVEYYDEDDRLTKVATLEKVAKIENWLTPVQISMTNKVAGSHSTIELEEVRYDVGLEPGSYG